MPSLFTEDALIEQPAIVLLSKLGWETANCFDETFGAESMLGRETSSEVILFSRLRAALAKLNSELPSEALELAIQELSRERSLMSMVNANQEIFKLLKDGVKVTFRDREGVETVETVRVIDWDDSRNNDFFLASQFWVTGQMHKRRLDLVGFVNGIPLLFIELKASHKNVQDAFQRNLRDYKDTIPHLFWYNGLLLLSNGSLSRLGSITSQWEHFSEWKKINSEGEEGVISLETMLRGICEPSRFLDIIENFTLFQKGKGGLLKIVAKNHQFLGVNNSFDAVRNLPSPSRRGMPEGQGEVGGRLGVFWHTQGSGKSFSMIFFAQKVLRKLKGNWTFLVVTDRTELDDQIYKNFADAGAVTEPQNSVRAGSGDHLQQLLTEDHRYVFTLIHKFYTEGGKTYPALTQRDDIIVMTDEAHRSQYDVLALNMRNALPNAAFIGFTGTPLMAGEERTKQVFGDYVSTYNFRQSVEDGATVPLYYENRIPELQLVNQALNEDMGRLLEDAELDEAQERKLEREFSREYHLITRDDRLEKIAEDIVVHFMGRGFHGKAMVVAVDKATDIRMYDKVKRHWNLHLAALQAELETCDPLERPELETKIQYMQSTDMAVVISQGQNEIDDMRRKGLDIRPHRKRMLEEDLDTKFKDDNDPLRIAFVCAMWMTGFDVPSCSTIYLDKPMKNHTLMQTIARANRVFGEKVNGLIVDYIGIFRDLQKALAIYGSGIGGKAGTGELPVETKAALVDELREAITVAKDFLAQHDVNLGDIQSAEGFLRVRLLDEAVKAILPVEDAADALLVNDHTKQQYLSLANRVELLFQAILPEISANEFGIDRKAIVIIADKIRSLSTPADISTVMGDVETLLDQSIAPKGYEIRETKIVDLRHIDFEKLKKQFERARKHIEIEKLRGQINLKLAQMLQLNKYRMNFYEQFQKLIAEYNSGAANADAFFAQLVTFAQNLNEEEKRGVAESLNEEELALFDILTRPNMKLSRDEKKKVKEVAKELLDTLKVEKLVLDWRKKQQTRAAVQLTIEHVLDQLPSVYSPELYQSKCSLIYQHVYDNYYGSGKSIYI
jgi:type I restriction enzyme R subunit